MITIVTTTWEVLTQRQWEPFGAVAVMLFMDVFVRKHCKNVVML